MIIISKGGIECSSDDLGEYATICIGDNVQDIVHKNNGHDIVHKVNI